MKRIFPFILFVSLFNPSTKAEPAQVKFHAITKTDANCTKDKAHLDLYPGFRFTEGPFDGLCVSELRRSALLLQEDKYKKLYEASDDDYLIANFQKNKKFYIARIPKNAIERVDWMIEDFGKLNPASHSFLRFKLKENSSITLFPQDEAATTAPEIVHDDLALSIDGVARRGDNPIYPIKGIMTNYALVYRFMVLSDKGNIAITKLGRKITFLPLMVDANEAFQVALNEASQSSVFKEYNTIDQNCTSEAYRLVSLTKGVHLSSYDRIFRNMQPRDAFYFLQKANLVDLEKAKLMNLSFNKEFYESQHKLPAQK